MFLDYRAYNILFFQCVLLKQYISGLHSKEESFCDSITGFDETVFVHVFVVNLLSISINLYSQTIYK